MELYIFYSSIKEMSLTCLFLVGLPLVYPSIPSVAFSSLFFFYQYTAFSDKKNVIYNCCASLANKISYRNLASNNKFYVV